jgi:glycosyltransferase involved in cell wall biosynthesis
VKLLFLHKEFPGQFYNVVAHAARLGHEVVFLSRPTEKSMPGVDSCFYEEEEPPEGLGLARTFAHDVARAEAVYRACEALRGRGFVPDAVLGYVGWGETMFVKTAFPDARLVGYCEWYHGQPLLPEDEEDAGWKIRCRARNAAPLLALTDCHAAVSPTAWQRAQFPAALRERIEVLHDGVDTGFFAPVEGARLVLGDLDLSSVDELVTYAARGLEPIRGFPEMMRAAALVLRERPRAHVVIAGWDDVFYDASLEAGETWRQRMLAELDVDEERLHFVGPLSYADLRKLYRASSVHVYLTRPFVLSWSVVEAMSTGAIVVGSDTPPVRELIEDGVNGLLASLDDPSAIARRIVEVLEHPRSFEPLRERARSTVLARYDLASLLPDWLALVTGQGRRP